MFQLVPTEATVAASTPRRQISGLAVPWGVTATVSGGQRVRFERDSIVVPDPPSRVVLLDGHDAGEPTGYLASAVSTHQGLATTFQLGSGPRSDAALRDALELIRSGLSVGVDTADPDRPPLEDPDGTLVFTADRPAILRETSQLALPAYTDARVVSVAASAPLERPTAMSDESAPTTPPPAPVLEETPTAAAAVLPTLPGPAIAAAAPELVAVRSEPFPYTFAGVGPSILKDYVDARDGNDAATARLRRAREMMATIPAAAVLAGQNPSILAAMSGAAIQAAPGSTTVDVSDLAQTMLRPDLWLPLIEKMTPLYNATTKVPLDKPNPFLYPATVAVAGIPDATTNAEGTAPDVGTIQTDPITVTPALINGGYQFTRTLMESASPGIDVVAAQAIQESMAEAIEAKVATALQAVTDTATVATTGALLIGTYRTALGTFLGQRFQPPTHLLASTSDYTLAITGDDTTGRPLIPPVGAMNSVGAAQAAAGALDFYNLPGGLTPAWALTTKHSIMVRQADVLSFATPLQSFRFEEKDGPELIDLYFRMYLVVHVRRTVGVLDLVHP